MIRTFSLSQKVIDGWIEDLKNWLYNFFNPELTGYTNFDFGSGEMLNIRIIIFGIFIGVLAASLYTIYVKNVIGAFVRKLLSEECLSEDRAKTLDELGFSNNIFVRRALRGSLLRSTVTHVLPANDIAAQATGNIEPVENAEAVANSGSKENAEAVKDAEEKGGISSQNQPQTKPCATDSVRYYIKEERKHISQMRFNARGSGWPTFFFVLLISVICIFLIFAFLPQILRFFDNTISIFSVEGNTVK